MKTKTEYEQLLMVILDDLRVCLRYTPNRENDLLCFMEQYLKGNNDNRPWILGELRACMDGEEYPNPYLAYQHYSEQEVHQLEQLLCEYARNMKTHADKEVVLVGFITAVNELQDKCCGQLLDNWRSDHLTQLVDSVAREVSFSSALSLIDSESRW